MERNEVKVLVMGAGGMAGHMISIYLSSLGYNVYGLSRRNLEYVKTVILDVLDKNSLLEHLHNNRYDLIINAIGILNNAAESNRSQAVLLNSFLPHFIAETILNTNTKMIHISTDCVFSGKNPPYYEHSLRDGETFYDRSKALGEVDDNSNLTIRTSIIGPDINKKGIGLLNWFFQQNTRVFGYRNAIWSGVTTLELAKSVDYLYQSNITGLVNLVNNSSISKYNLLSLVKNVFNLENIEILPNDTIVIDKSLKNTRSDININIPTYAQMIEQLEIWMNDHLTLYPHYRRPI